jgi:hypothetical protein
MITVRKRDALVRTAAEDVKEMRTVRPPPDAGANYFAVPHRAMIDAVLTGLDVVGLAAEWPPPDSLFVTADGYDMTAGFRLTPRHGRTDYANWMPAYGDWQLGLTVKTSNARRHRLTFYAGVYVAPDKDKAGIPTVGMPFRPVYQAGPFVKAFDLDREVATGVRECQQYVRPDGGLKQDLYAARTRTLTKEDASLLFAVAVRERMTPPSRMGPLAEDLLSVPERGVSMMEVYWMFCKAAARNPPAEQTRQCLMFLKMLQHTKKLEGIKLP